jgi:hypothetical protein
MSLVRTGSCPLPARQSHRNERARRRASSGAGRRDFEPACSALFPLRDERPAEVEPTVTDLGLGERALLQ